MSINKIYSSFQIQDLKKLVLFMVSFVTLAGCATAITYPAIGGDILGAIKQNDARKVRDLLKDKSFVGSTINLPWTDHSRMTEEETQARQLMDMAITGRIGNNRGDDVCRPAVVTALLDAGLAPLSSDIAESAIRPCTKVVETLLSRLPPEKVTEATDSTIGAIVYQLREGAGLSKVEAWSEVLQLLKQKDPASDQKIAVVESALLKLHDTKARGAAAVNKAKSDLETKYGIPFCSNPNLFSSVFNPFGKSLEPNCIYIIHGPIKVLQIVEGGLLATLIRPSPELPDKAIFIKTKKQYVDEDLVGDILVRVAGTTKYANALGVEKTVQKFQYLGDVNLSDGGAYNEYHLRPDQN